MTTTNALEEQITALICQLKETREAERREEVRREAECKEAEAAAAEKAREEEQRRLQAEAEARLERGRCGFTLRKVPLVCMQRSSCRRYVTHLFAETFPNNVTDMST